MKWFLTPSLRKKTSRSARATKSKPRRRTVSRRRTVRVEQLEGRSLLAALPYGAMPDDTGEFMLGDVYVSVVLMESNPALSPGDNNPQPQGLGAPAENWASNTVNTISAVKQKVQDGLKWWEDTLDGVLAGTEAAGRDLLNFTIDWTYADNPVQTGYEPIARTSNDFVLWMYDFLNVVGFNQTGNFSSDIRAYNNFKREQSGSDWAFTVFVVNNEADEDEIFAPGGQFTRAFSFAGGRMAIVPANRPGSTFAHEFGHMFWGLDEYSGTTANYLTSRGYYNTPNSNHASNPEEGFTQQNSIMANDPAREAAWNGKVSSTSSKEMIGWRDSDGDGLFDVLDVPFHLEGIGRYDAASGQFLFTGSSNVKTLPNKNPSGLQNDITINQIREVQVSIDGGEWSAVQTLPARTYQTALNLSIPLSAGDHTIKIRTIDTRTGAKSPEFIGSTSSPTQTPSPGGVSGFVYEDRDSDGTWDSGEPPLPDWALDLVDQFGVELDFRRQIEPNQYAELAVLNSVHTDAVLSAVGSEVSNGEVRARTSTHAGAAGRVFVNNSIIQGNNLDTWNASRQLRIDFNNPISSLSIKAYGAGSSSVGRLEVYDNQGRLLDRYTTGLLAGGNFETMSLRRPEGDIAYAIARGHAGSNVVLDSLQWGPFASATTNTLGAYSLSALPPGSYRIRVNPPPMHFVTTYPNGEAPVAISAGGSVSNINFGISTEENPWHNDGNSLNVNGDAGGNVSPLDALLVINWLNTHPNNPALPAQATPLVHGYIDVNNDGFCTPLDALLVINTLNAPQGLVAPAQSQGGSPPASLSSPEIGQPEGELAAIAPAESAADYYARGPLHFLHIAGDEEVCIHDDELGELDHDHIHTVADTDVSPAPLTDLAKLRLAQPPLFVLDAGSIDSALPSLSEELLDRASAQFGDYLPEAASAALAGRARRLAEALEEAALELDEVLETIAPEVAETWSDALSRVLRRLPHGLG